MNDPRRFTVLIKKAAEREMDSLPAATFRQVTKAILSLESTPRRRGTKKLQGRDVFRLRVGDYRVLYTVCDSTRTVEVVAVGHRKDVYR